MGTLKSIVCQRFKMLSILSLSLILSIVLLMIRAKINQSFYLLFLVWNLFLATIPFAITTVLVSQKKHKPLNFFLVFGVWLLFLPNSPYIVTDLLHLRHSRPYLMWLDVLVIVSFAFNGLVLFMLSVWDMETLLKQFLRPSLLTPMILSIFGLTAFGIYLGRFLRYNSWEVLNQPRAIFKDMIHLIFEPNTEAWMFTFTFGSFLAIAYWMLKALFNSKSY